MQVITPSIEDARLAFRVVNTKGEPLDLPTVVKHRLGNGAAPNVVLKIERDFDEHLPGIDLNVDTTNLFAALRAFRCRVHLAGGDLGEDSDPEVIAVKLPTPLDAAGVAQMSRYLAAAADISTAIDINIPVIGDGPARHMLKALQALMTYEECGRRVPLAEGMGFRTPAIAQLWRAVATKILVVLNIRVDTVDRRDYALAVEALRSLERVLLFCSLPNCGGDAALKNRLDLILTVRGSLTMFLLHRWGTSDLS